MVLCDVEVEIYSDGAKVWEYKITLIGIDSDTVAKMLENEYGYSIEWISGSDFEFWKVVGDYRIEGMLWGVSDVDGSVVVMNADELIVRALFGYIDKMWDVGK